ncbi:MAG: C-terminal binding protein, partial [Eubacteriales bacterium]|nr:C-terminal binding protein [Eubacteriales bacterium]
PDLILERDMLGEVDAELIEVTDPATIKDACRDADAVINTYMQLTPDIIESMGKCKLIIRNGIGVNTIDVDTCNKKGIMVANVPSYCLDEVATHAITLLLALARKIVLLNATVHQGVWDVKKAIPVYSLQGKTLGLVGFGKIPRLVYEKAKPFGLNVMMYDPYVTEEAAKEAGVQKAGLERLLEESDFISVHCPLTAETKHMFNAEAFGKMKKSAYIINTARGPLINESDLIEALQQGKIAGAGLDVLTQDSVDPANPLLMMGNVIITPHAAWYSEESIVTRRRQTVESVISVLEGGEPASLINRKQLGR